MALNINGTGQDSFDIDGIDLDNLYIDGVLVFSKTPQIPVLFEMLVTSTTEPVWYAVGGTLINEDNGDGTWTIYSHDVITHISGGLSVTENVTKVVFVTCNTLTNGSFMFANSNLLTSIDMTALDTSNMTNMDYMFYQCSSLTDIDVTMFNTTNVTNMSYMFHVCHGLSSLDLSSFDFSNVTNFTRMFDYCLNLVCISNIDTETSGGDTSLLFNNCPLLEAPTALEQSDLTDGNGAIYVNAGPCPSLVPEPPTYLMTEALKTKDFEGSTYWYLDNSSTSGDIYDGRLEHVGDGWRADGFPWDPGSLYDPILGVIDLTIQGDGEGSRRIMTGWTPATDSEWSMSGIYNVDFGISYDMYILHYLGNGTVDIFLGSNTVLFQETPTYSAVEYIPEQVEWVITEDAPDIITVSGIIYEMNNFGTI